MPPVDAVGDMIWKLERARDRLPDEGGPYLASIILDGENAWEQYPNNGNDFLRTLYGTLQTDERFETVRVSEYLAQHPARFTLPKLHTGSWIDGSLRVWAGEAAHVRAWAALERTRRFAQEQGGALRSCGASACSTWAAATAGSRSAPRAWPRRSSAWIPMRTRSRARARRHARWERATCGSASAPHRTCRCRRARSTS